MSKISLVCLISAIAIFFSSAVIAQESTPQSRPVAPCPAVISALGVHAPDASKVHSNDQPLSGALYDCGHPTNEEQYMLELINRARANPAAEGLRLDTTTDPTITFDYSYFLKNGVWEQTPTEVDSAFATYPVRPPLAMNGDLITAARGHDNEMIIVDSQYHVGPDGNPGSRITAAGYTTWNTWGENVYAYGDTDVWADDASFLIDFGNPDLGHRHNIMNFASTDAVYTEVGLGMVHGGKGLPDVGTVLTTEDFVSSPKVFILGVVYTDSNKSGFYAEGEGDSGVTITLSSGNYYAVSSGSGGYAIPFSGTGSVTVTATGKAGGPFATPYDTTIDFEGQNVKVDFIASPTPPSPPGKVSLITPTNNSTTKDTVNFTWQALTTVPSKYLVQVSKESNLSKPFVVSDTLDGSVTSDTAAQRLEPNTTYYWGVYAENEGGWNTTSNIWSFKTPAAASVNFNPSMSSGVFVSPNPSNGSVHLQFALTNTGDVTFALFNSAGAQVQLTDAGMLPSGLNNYTLDVSNLAAGIYQCQIQQDGSIQSAKLVVIK